jgi:hypothetical protein
MMINAYKQACPVSLFGELFTRRAICSETANAGTPPHCRTVLSQVKCYRVAARSKKCFCSRSLAGAVGSNPARECWCLSVVSVCCKVEVSATNWSLLQRSPTDYDVSLCLIWKHEERGGHTSRWAAAPQEEKEDITCVLNVIGHGDMHNLSELKCCCVLLVPWDLWMISHVPLLRLWINITTVQFHDFAE